MKKTALASIIFFALVFSLFSGAKAVQFDHGEFKGLPYTPPIVTVFSPSPNESYKVPDVLLNVTVQIRTIILHNMERVRWLNYSLDGETAIPLTLNEPSLSEISQLPYTVYGSHMLTGLSDGSHTLTIFGKTSVSGLNGYFNVTIYFNVNTDKSTIPTSPTPMPYEVPQPIEQEIILGLAFTVAVLGVGLGLLIYLIKRK